jgi:hypothetical protein
MGLMKAMTGDNWKFSNEDYGKFLDTYEKMVGPSLSKAMAYEKHAVDFANSALRAMTYLNATKDFQLLRFGLAYSSIQRRSSRPR